MASRHEQLSEPTDLACITGSVAALKRVLRPRKTPGYQRRNDRVSPLGVSGSGQPVLPDSGQ